MPWRTGRIAVLLALYAIAPTAWCDNHEQGRFLLAAAGLSDPNFAGTVVLLIRHDSDGAVGLIVNRPTGVAAREVLPEVAALSGYQAPVFFGGPVMLDRMMVLLRTDEAPAEAELVADDVYVSASGTVLAGLPAGYAHPERVRIYAGHAGWGPGQLEREIAAGGWHLVPARMNLLFEAPQGPDWRQLLPDSRLLSADASAESGSATLRSLPSAVGGGELDLRSDVPAQRSHQRAVSGDGG